MPLLELNRNEAWEPVDGFKAKFVHTEKMSIGFFSIKTGSALPEHTHFHEQVSIIKEGEMELTVGDETYRLKSGQILTMPSNPPRSGQSTTGCEVMDKFCPVREDYRKALWTLKYFWILPKSTGPVQKAWFRYV